MVRQTDRGERVAEQRLAPVRVVEVPHRLALPRLVVQHLCIGGLSTVSKALATGCRGVDPTHRPAHTNALAGCVRHAQPAPPNAGLAAQQDW
jgi:hypothetical protein